VAFDSKARSVMVSANNNSSRRWLFRVAAMALGLLPFVLLEFALRWLGVEASQTALIPSVLFAEEHPLFVLDSEPSQNDRAQYVIPPSRQPFFKPDRFAAKKDPREFRIFCLGGSTVQGNPYSIETSFTTWLELSLQAADASRQWQVINCGGISYASYRLSPILTECLKYEPDLFVLYLGDNEFLEERSYFRGDRPSYIAWLDQLRLVQTARGLYHEHFKNGKSPATEPIRLAAEVDALLDYQGGLAQYHRDDRLHAAVVDHFRLTLDQMLSDARRAGVPVLLVDPVCNLKDCAPFKVELDKTLRARDAAQFQKFLTTAGQSTSAEQSIEDLRAALAIDPRHAGAWYLLGQAYLAINRDAEAREAFLRAKDEDICPLRMIEPMRAIIYQLAKSTEVPVVPVMHLFESKSPHGIPGDELMLDHVHPSITGHQMMADLMLEVMVREGFAQLDENWKAGQQRKYREHLATLDTPYFARGQEHLDGLRKWAQGRVKKLRAVTPAH
jgi:tetratricopeptide (TPR) repeat protein